jgi:predicted PurR-regulated permease PerM
MHDDARQSARRLGPWRDELAFLRRVLIVAGVAVLLLFLWAIRDAMLMAFAAVLVALVIRMAADQAERRLRVPGRWSVVVACIAIGLPFVLVLLLVGNEASRQIGELVAALPRSLETLEQRFGIRIPMPAGDGGMPDASTAGAVARQAASAAWIAADAVAAFGIVVVGGIYFAADPTRYRRGLARLVPRGEQRRAEEAMDASGRALSLWLLAQLLSMGAVGVLVGLGAWAVGLPAPLALGLFAGLVNIVPLIGPFIGAIPGVLLALNHGLDMLLWAIGLYLLVQQIEGNIILPLASERMVSLPPALLIFAFVAASAVFGLGGVLLAAPLTVVAVVLVSKLYVRDTLGRPASVPGEAQTGAAVAPGGERG